MSNPETPALETVQVKHNGTLKAFQIPGLFLEIEEALSYLPQDAECPAEITEKVNKLCSEGPAAMDNLVLAVKNLEGEAATIDTLIAQLRARRDAKLSTAGRFKRIGLDVVDGIFNGKIKTDLFTIYGQDHPSTGYDFDSADPAEQLALLKTLDPRFVKVEYTLRKKDLSEAVKAGEAIPAGLHEVKRSSRFFQVR